MPEISTLLTTEEAAARLRLATGTLHIWRHYRRSTLPFVKVGRKVFYKAEDVQAYLEKRTDPGDGPRPSFATTPTSALPTRRQKRRARKHS